MVVAHPEPTSFSHALSEAARKALERDGHEVCVSDLHAEKWDPNNDRRNFTTVNNAERFVQQHEEPYALANDGFHPAIRAEIEKLQWCDLLIFYFPIHWFSMPAMLKSWVDKVFTADIAYGGGHWYDTGKFLGKRAFLTLTTGSPHFFFRHDDQ